MYYCLPDAIGRLGCCLCRRCRFAGRVLVAKPKRPPTRTRHLNQPNKTTKHCGLLSFSATVVVWVDNEGLLPCITVCLMR
jgi:hypothetical protein